MTPRPRRPPGGGDGDNPSIPRRSGDAGGGTAGRRRRTSADVTNVARAQDETAAAAQRGRPGTSGRHGGSRPPDRRTVPHGFRDFHEFQQFASQVRDRMRGPYPDLEMGFQGSAVTGRSADSGTPFDVDRRSDFDIAITGESLYAAARERGVPFRGDGVSTGPLSEADVRALGFDGIVADASADAGRPVNLMIFRAIDDAVARRPTIRVWF